MAKKLNYDFLDCVVKMPNLKHRTDNKEFNIMDSEVCAWLVSQPSIRQKIFNMAVNNSVIKFNPDTGKWQGVDYEEDD